jgi:fructose-1,6-bisphosphatase/inositol monophosphatase family enzyme
MNKIETLFAPIKLLHEMIRDGVVEICEKSSLDKLSAVAADEEGDTIFAVDRVGEEILVDFFEREIASKTPIILIAEGLDPAGIVLPRTASESDAVWRIIVDPIDGTRGLMYQKRSAWILTGIAPNRGEETKLSHIEFAIQTEIPLVKQHLSDTVWAFRGQGARGQRYNRITGEKTPLSLKPSSATTISQGFAGISRFFPGAREVLAEIDEEVVRAVLGRPEAGKAQCFEDQYICSGGQLYELMAGHDRFIADLRPLMEDALRARGFDLPICCHPYDLCTAMIARELGVLVTSETGETLDAPLTLEANVGWIGYANEAIRGQIEPALLGALAKRGLI